MKRHSSTDLSGQTFDCALSDDELYRLFLSCHWSKGPVLYFWLLNPSIADHTRLDRTFDGLIKRARRWGYAGVAVLNLFALRATDPRDMLRASDPVGPENDRITRQALRRAFDDGSPVIAGWGKHGSHRGRDRVAQAMAAEAGVQLMALEINLDGSPKHPLYVAHEKRPISWPGKGE